MAMEAEAKTVVVSRRDVVESREFVDLGESVTVEVPANALLLVAYEAEREDSEPDGGSSALFFNGVQLSVPERPVRLARQGRLWSHDPRTPGLTLLDAGPGTYEVEVRHRADRGVVAVSDRKLSAWPLLLGEVAS